MRRSLVGLALLTGGACSSATDSNEAEPGLNPQPELPRDERTGAARGEQTAPGRESELKLERDSDQQNDASGGASGEDEGASEEK
ncbi:MAG: hypothetical protein ACOY0T_18600 [Myxococcota bacterium]